MGGIGSGLPGSGKQTVEGCYVIDVVELARRGGLGGRCVGGPAPVYIPEPRPAEMRAGFVSEAEGQSGALELFYMVRRSSGGWTPVRQKITVGTTPLTYGGVRPWFHCPIRKDGRRCFRRCRLVYLPVGAARFGCRQCHSLAYQSQRLSPLDCILQRMDKLEQELGWDTGTSRRRPTGMHRRRYQRLLEEYYDADAAWMVAGHHRLTRLLEPERG